MRGRVDSQVTTLKNLVLDGFSILQNTVISNVFGGHLSNAFGLSFYFPTRDVHSSYLKTVFDNSTKWSTFLKKYINVARAQQPKEEKLDIPAPAHA
jgi:hypothetical protein